MTIKVGDQLPDVRLAKATDNGPEAVQSGDYFKGKRVALFSVPGAFTPTCSAKHLPGYVEKAGELKAKGIDEIACTAVNDAFVMGAWGKRDGGEAVTMLGDGNGDLVDALGLTFGEVVAPLTLLPEMREAVGPADGGRLLEAIGVFRDDQPTGAQFHRALDEDRIALENLDLLDVVDAHAVRFQVDRLLAVSPLGLRRHRKGDDEAARADTANGLLHV